MLYAPRATLVSLLEAPRWADVLILTFVVTTLCSVALLKTDVGQLALLDQWERTAAAFGRNVDDAQYATLEEASRNDATAYGVVTSFAAGPLLSLVLSVVLFGIFRSAGTTSSFQQVLAVVSHAGVILALRQVVETPLMYLRETLASPITLGLMASPINEASPLARFLGIVDLFVLWWIVVLAIGTATLYRRSARRLALMFVGAYLAVAVILAAFMAATGGTA